MQVRKGITNYTADVTHQPTTSSLSLCHGRPSAMTHKRKYKITKYLELFQTVALLDCTHYLILHSHYRSGTPWGTSKGVSTEKRGKGKIQQHDGHICDNMQEEPFKIDLAVSKMFSDYEQLHS